MICLDSGARRQSVSQRFGSGASKPHRPQQFTKHPWLQLQWYRRAGWPGSLVRSVTFAFAFDGVAVASLADRLSIPTSSKTLLGMANTPVASRRTSSLRWLRCITPAKSRQKRDLHNVCLDRRETTGYRLPHTRGRGGCRSVWNQYDPIRLSVAYPIRVFGHTANVWLPKSAQFRT
jgi:hypothetical protein